MQKNSKNFPDLTLYSNELDYIFENFTSFSAFKLYLFLLKRSRFGENPENLAKYSLKRIGDELKIQRQNIHKSMQVLEEMGLIIRKNGFIEKIFKISNISPPNCNKSYDDRNKSYDSSSYNLLQDVILFMTSCNISYDKKSIESFTALVNDVSHYSSHYTSLYTFHYEGCFLLEFLNKIKSKKIKETTFNKICALLLIVDQEKFTLLFNQVQESGIHILGIIDEMIEIIIYGKKEKIRATSINKILRTGISKNSQLTDEHKKELNQTEIEFLTSFGVGQLSKSSEYEINQYIDMYCNNKEN